MSESESAPAAIGVDTWPGPSLPGQPLLMRWANAIARLSRPAAILISSSLVVLMGVADFATGNRLNLSRLYVIPISILTWSQGRRAGVLIAAAASAVWIASDQLTKGVPSMNVLMVDVWNGALRAGFLLAVAIVLSSLRESLLVEKRLARTDFLTGVANRRFFFEWANIEIKRSRRYQHAFIAAYLDIDDFKSINDRFGHNQGDALLRLVAQTLLRSIREVDLVARLGGDEFAILLPETGAHAADDVMKKVQRNLIAAMQENKWPATFSIGAVTYVRAPVSVDEMIKAADTLMYAVKGSGKNTIHHQVVENTN